MSIDEPTQEQREIRPEDSKADVESRPDQQEDAKSEVDSSLAQPEANESSVESRPDESESPQPEVDPRMQARRTGVRTRRRRRIWISIGIVVVLVAAALGITQSPLLDVDEVEIIGVRHTSVEQVLEAAGVEVGAPLLGLDLAGPRKAIAGLPWVDQVRSSRTWGGNITFDITEREAVAQIPVEAGWALADRQGRVLGVTPTTANLPTVLYSPIPEPGGWLRGPVLPLLEVSEALIPLQASGIGSISFVNGQVVVELAGGGEAHWGGRDDPRGKATALATVMAKVDLECLERVNLSVPELPVLTRYDDCP